MVAGDNLIKDEAICRTLYGRQIKWHLDDNNDQCKPALTNFHIS